MNNSKIYTNDRCVGCNRCINSCPCSEANVAVMEDGKNKIYIDESKCIACGECIRTCVHEARDYNDDTAAFLTALTAGQSIAVIAAPALRTNFANWPHLLGYLKQAGVSFLFDTSFGADICTWAYLRYMTAQQSAGLISQPCPAIVNYIERYAHHLLPKLAPIHSPAMCTAVYMKKYKQIPGSYAFLSPCIAKKDEFSSPQTHGLVSYNVTFKKLDAALRQRGVRYQSYPAAGFDNEQHGLGAVYPMPGGLRVNVEQYVNNIWIHQVEGQPHTCRFLDSYTTAQPCEPFLIDILNCQHGCNLGTGALCHEKEQLQVGQRLFTAAQEVKQTAKGKTIPGPPFAKFDKELALSDFTRSYARHSAQQRTVTPSALEDAFQRLKKPLPEQRIIDCSSCGFDTCAQMAQAVAKDINHVENCAEYFKNVLGEQKLQLEAMARQSEEHEQELRANVEDIFKAIGHSSERTESIVRDVELINEKIASMNRISDHLASLVSELETEISKYAVMSDKIVNISSQTNILALNASVEAARAGQYGKGFAVVAEHIKALSDQSRKSAVEAAGNNDIIMPLLQKVDAGSDGVLAESQSISHSARNILEALTALSEWQRTIETSAMQIMKTE